MIISLVMPEAPERLRHARQTELRPAHRQVHEQDPEKRENTGHQPL
jgi:hypothetical protein